MRRFGTVLGAILLLTASVPGRCGEQEDLAWENRLLQGELELAKSGKLYVVFDLPERQVFLKAKGVTLRTFPVASVSVWGDPLDVTPLPLLRRSALLPPARPQLKPGDADYTPATAKPNAEPEALELKDMPAEYSLVLDGGVSITVEARPTTFWTRVRHIWRILIWSLRRPLATLAHAYRRTPFTSVRLLMDQQDARGLYWGFPEGLQSIIFLPGK